MSTSDTVIKLAELTGKSARIEPPFVLSDAERHAIEHEVAHYPDARAASIGALKIVQAHRGWVPDGAIEPVAAMLGIGGAELEGVATFYNLIFRKPVGRHVIPVCDSISFFLPGYEDLKVSLEKTLRSGYGQTNPEGPFTIQQIHCLGAGDKGPTR